MKNLFSQLALCGLILGIAGAAAGCSNQAQSNRHVERARKESAAGNYERAELEYLSALKANPTNSAAVAGLGVVYFQCGKASQAHGVLTRALELDPANIEARVKLGMVLASFGQPRQAWTNAEQVLQKDPGNGEALVLLAESSTTDKQLADCIARLESLPAAKKGGAAEHMVRGILKMRANDLAAAEAEFKQAVAADPKSERPHLALVAVYKARKQLPEAEASFKAAVQVAPLRSPARISYAHFLAETGRAEEARKVVSEVTDKVPDFMPAWVFLAELAMKQNNLKESEALVKKILDRDPVNYDGALMDGRLLLVKGDGPAAVKRFEWIVQSYGTNAERLYLLASAYVENKQDNQAILALERALVLSSNYVDAVLLQSGLLFKQGNYTRVATLLPPFLQRGPQLTPEQQSKLPHAFVFLAKAQAALGNVSQAAGTYEAMRKAFSSPIELNLQAGDGLAELNFIKNATNAYLHYVELSTNELGLVLAGARLARIKENPSARLAFEKARKISPNYMPALDALVQLDLNETNHAAAISMIKQQIETDKGTNAFPWVLLAKAHIGKATHVAKNKLGKEAPDKELLTHPTVQEDVTLAEEALLKAAEIDPGMTAGHHLLAQLYVATNKEKEALARLNSLVARTNDATAYIQIALIHSASGDHKAAADAYETVLQSAPNSVDALNNLAVLYAVNLPRLDRAYELAQKAQVLSPDSPAVADTLGWVLYKRGEYTRALKLLEPAAKNLPDEPEVQFHLGMTYYMLGQEQDAEKALKSAISSPKPYEGKQQATNRLEVLAIDPAKADAAALAVLDQKARETPSDIIVLGRQAAILERDKKFDNAVERYQAILKVAPKHAQAWYKLARIYADHLGQADKAFEAAKTARNIAPEDPGIAHVLARLALQKGNWSWAATLLEEASNRLPNDPQVASDLAWATYYIGRVPEAKARMQVVAENESFQGVGEAKQFVKFVGGTESPAEVEKLAGEAGEILKTNASYLPALVLSAKNAERTGDYSKAAGLYEKMLPRWPAFTPVYRDLAVISLEKLNNDQRAYEMATKAREAYPADSQVARTLGITIVKLKRPENPRAVQMLKEAARTRTDDAELFYYLGIAQFRLKANAESRKSLEQALNLKLSAPLAADANKMLADLK